jgi:hypothetical protein
LTTRLQKYVRRFAEAKPALPFLHTTDTSSFRKALPEKSIRAVKACGVFGDHVVYLFYGRPAYKVAVNEDQRATDDYLPVAVIVKPDAVRRVKRAFPFDSGAFHDGAYGTVMHHQLGLPDFELGGSLGTVRRLVKAFFGTNGHYVLGECRLQGKPDSFDHPEACALFALIDGPTNVLIDDRRYTLEVQTEDPISLADDVSAIVMPHTWLKSATMKSFLRDHPHVEPLTYARFRGAQVSALHAAIFERVTEYLHKNDYLADAR